VQELRALGAIIVHLGIERHDALLPLPVRRERWIVSQLVPRLWMGAPMGIRYRTL
jgi:hypothetical protein